MTKEEVVQLGVAAKQARDLFEALCWENTKTDPAERAAQILRFEYARVEMYAAMNRHHAALEQL